METVSGVIALILAVPLWFLYHKLFRVHYRNNNVIIPILGELLGAFITAQVIVGAAGSIAVNIGTFILNVIFNYIIPLWFVWLVSALIWRFIRARKGVTEEPKGLGIIFNYAFVCMNKFPGALRVIMYLIIMGFGLLKILFLLGLE